jgi:hypothetical protein
MSSIYSYLLSAALMWSVLTFLLAFAILFFDRTSAVTRAITGPALAFVVGLVAWCIINSWTEEDWWLRNIWTLTREGFVDTTERVHAWRTVFRRREKSGPEVETQGENGAGV